MEIRQTACPLDCPDACSLDVTVDNGQVVKIDGNSINSYTDGYICAKVRKYPEHVYGKERILKPAIRQGKKGEGEFREASWEEALGLITDRMQEAARTFSGESILPLFYGGSNGYLTQDSADTRLFQRIGASQLLRTVCAAPSGAAAKGLYGKMSGVAFEDYPEAKTIILWGVNPGVSGIHLLPYLNEAQENGAKLVVVDPRAHRLARKADYHLQVRPGTDLALALCMIRWLWTNEMVDHEFLSRHATGADQLFEKCEPWSVGRTADVTGVPEETIETVARLYGESSPALIRCGWGLERNRNGGSAVAAVLALPAVAGKFGVRGGGYTMSNSGAWALDPEKAAGVTGYDPTLGPAPRSINMNKVGQALAFEDSPPIKVVFVYNCNPLAILPRQELVYKGLAREDLFTVVYDQVLTDTARFADVILPATTFLEHREIRRGYGAVPLQEGLPVIEPVGESRPNFQVFNELCHRLGVNREGDAETEEEFVDRLLEQTGRKEDYRQALAKDKIVYPECGVRPVLFQDSYPMTEDRKVHLFPEDLDQEAPRGLYVYQEDPGTTEYPLALISPATGRTISSSLGQLYRDQVGVAMSPKDAGDRGLSNGDTIRLFNDLGEVVTHVEVSDEMPEGVVFLPKGIWCQNTANGRTSNAVSPDTLTDLGAGACYNDARVEVERKAHGLDSGDLGTASSSGTHGSTGPSS